jgi:hypothetical protein
MLGLLSFAIAVLGPVMSLALYTDLVCDNPSDFDKGTGTWCWIQRMEPFLRQALFAFLTFHVYLMWRSICRRCSLTAEMSKRRHWRLHLAVFATPLLLCITWAVHAFVYKGDLTATFEETTYDRLQAVQTGGKRQVTDHAVFNSSRETFTCDPLFTSPVLEFVEIYLLNIIMCVLTTVMVGQVLKTCLDVAHLKLLQENATRNKYKKMFRWMFQAIGPSHRKLLFLCSACSILTVMQLVCAFTLFPRITDNAIAIQNWALCSQYVDSCAAAARSNNEFFIEAFAANCNIVSSFTDQNGGTCGDQPPLAAGTQSSMVLYRAYVGLLPLIISGTFSFKRKKKTGLHVHNHGGYKNVSTWKSIKVKAMGSSVGKLLRQQSTSRKVKVDPAGSGGKEPSFQNAAGIIVVPPGGGQDHGETIFIGGGGEKIAATTTPQPGSKRIFLGRVRATSRL